MLSKLLYSIDFSETSEKINDEIIKLANCGIETLILLHVVEPKLLSKSPVTGQIIINDMYVEERAIDKAYQKLEKVKEKFEANGINTKVDVVKGKPFEEILVYSEKENATAIIIGEKGLNPIDRLLLGSTAEKVLRKSKIPVILIK